MNKIIFSVLLALLSLFILYGNSNAQNSSLYFCEDYVNGQEINVSNTFSPGWITVMLDLRPEETTLEVDKVYLTIFSVKSIDGKDSLQEIDKVPFDVNPDWDYVFFKDTIDLTFDDVGYYVVACQEEDGSTIAYGLVQIVPDEEGDDSDEDVSNNNNYKKTSDVHTITADERHAIDYYTKILKKDSENGDYRFMRAGAYSKAELYDSCIMDYKKCIKIDYRIESSRVNIGWAYFDKKSYDNALQAFREYEKKYSNNFDLKMGIALSHFKLKNFTKSKSYVDNIIEIVPEIEHGMNGINLFEARFNYKYNYKEKDAMKEMLDYFGYK
jgi:tetratricopeptide (TPR) repeat protein